MFEPIQQDILKLLNRESADDKLIDQLRLIIHDLFKSVAKVYPCRYTFDTINAIQCNLRLNSLNK